MTSTQIALVLAALVQVGALVGVYVKIQIALTEIKTKLQLDDKSKQERQQARNDAIMLMLGQHCRAMQAECPARRDFDQWVSPSQVSGPEGKRNR